jgi:repressor LexA
MHLARIREYYAQQGVMPSYAQLSLLLRFKAKNASFKLAARLVASGHLKVGPGGRLAPDELFFAVPVVDETVPAGSGEPADPVGGFSDEMIHRMLVGPKAKPAMVQITGDSMIEAGVLDGDRVVLDCGVTAQDGDFVVAKVDGRYTMKEYRLQRRNPVLLPRNPRYAPIEPRSELHILGVVTGIVRRVRKARPMRAKPAAEHRQRGDAS